MLGTPARKKWMPSPPVRMAPSAIGRTPTTLSSGFHRNRVAMPLVKVALCDPTPSHALSGRFSHPLPSPSPSTSSDGTSDFSLFWLRTGDACRRPNESACLAMLSYLEFKMGCGWADGVSTQHRRSARVTMTTTARPEMPKRRSWPSRFLSFSPARRGRLPRTLPKPCFHCWRSHSKSACAPPGSGRYMYWAFLAVTL